jgi:hypothetical protein
MINVDLMSDWASVAFLSCFTWNTVAWLGPTSGGQPHRQSDRCIDGSGKLIRPLTWTDLFALETLSSVDICSPNHAVLFHSSTFHVERSVVEKGQTWNAGRVPCCNGGQSIKEGPCERSCSQVNGMLVVRT